MNALYTAGWLPSKLSMLTDAGCPFLFSPCLFVPAAHSFFLLHNLPPIQTEFLTLPSNQKPVLVNQEPGPLPAVSKPPVSHQPLEDPNSENLDILAPISELSPEEENKSSVSGLSKSQSKSPSQAVVVGQTSVNASGPSTGRRQPRKKGVRCCLLL